MMKERQSPEGMAFPLSCMPSCFSFLLSAALWLVVPLQGWSALVVNPAMEIMHQLRVQPIIVSQAASEGGAAATFFGNAEQQAEIEGYVDTIWAQAGIDVVFLAPTTYVSSFAYDGYPEDHTYSYRPTVDLSRIVAEGPVSQDPTVLNLFFVEVVPGYPYTSGYSVNGLAFVDGNGVAMFVGSELLTFTAGLQGIAKVVAHEIGHNLGLDHLAEGGNLMQEADAEERGERISAAQIATIFTNDAGPDGFELLVPVPEPSSGFLGLVTLALAVSRRRRG